jgi:dTDP-4-dehydrorhamnose reductase
MEGSLPLDLAGKLPLMPEADVAVICAAMARFEDCRRYPELAHRVNVAAPLELGRSLTQAGARVILLSSSVVFDCRKPHVSESEQPMPASAYGRLKAEAEAGLLDLGPLVSVLRLTKVVRPNVGILSGWISSLGKGETIRAFEDHRFCPLTVEQVVDAIVALIENGEGGIYHVSGAADVSYADSARFLAQRIGATNELVEAVRGIENGLAEGDLTPFTSLATGRLSRLTGFVPPEPFDVLQGVYGRKIYQAREMLAARAG